MRSIFFIVLGFLLSFFHITITAPQIPPVQELISTTIAPQKNAKTLESEGNSVAYSLVRRVTSNSIHLISNLPKKENAEVVKDRNHCQYMTNAGFYTQAGQPIGLFLVDGITENGQSQNPTFNALFWGTNAGTSGIGQLLPDEPLAFALQSGPLLWEQKQPKELHLTTDEKARRIVAAIEGDGSVTFLAVFDKENPYGGPLLRDLPTIIGQIAQKESITIHSAINLDGGNHSVFYGDDVNLTELSPVGSVFCIKS